MSVLRDILTCEDVSIKGHLQKVAKTRQTRMAVGKARRCHNMGERRGDRERERRERGEKNMGQRYWKEPARNRGKFKDFSKIWHFIRRLISIEYSNTRQAVFT